MSSLTIHMGTAPPVGYFIAPGGSDSTGTGTIGNPWRTLGRFYSVATAGDTLYCRGGTYADTDLVYVDALDGTVGSPITARNYPGETPVFTGPATDGGAIQFRQGSSHHVIDGLQFASWTSMGSTGVIWIGDGSVDTGPLTIRNCKFTASVGWTDHAHPVYISGHAVGVTVEYCVMIGPEAGTYGAGAGVQAYNASVGPTGTVVDHCILDGFVWGTIVWGPGATATVTHNSYLNNYTNIDLRDHVATTVRDNAGENGTNANIYDPTDSAFTTASYNFWGQTFDANYYLVAGQSGRSAASDGTDAGALDW